MTLYEILLGVQYTSIALMIFICAYITKKWTKGIHGWLFFYCISVLGNNAGYLAIMNSTTEGEAILAWHFSYLFRVWISFSLMQFVIHLCMENCYRTIGNILAVFHAATYFLVLTMRHNTLYYTSFSFVETGLFPHLSHTNGIWHHLFCAVNFFYVIVAVYMLHRKFKLLKNANKKKQIIFIAATIFTDTFFYILNFFNLIPGYDTTAVGYTVASIFLCIALFAYDILDTKELARDFVIEHVSEGIIAANDDETVSFFNEKAKNIMPLVEDSPEKAIDMLKKLIDEEKPLKADGRQFTPKENSLGDEKQHAGKVFILSDDTRHYEYAEKLTKEMMIALSRTVDAKDHYTNGHSERVAAYSKEIARRMGKSEDEQEKIYEIALLHDIGKIGVSEEIINKTTRLTDEEFEKIKTHTTTGWKILHHISSMPDLAVGARHHHERFDGNGYPDKLKGKEIPEEARIICVADCYDAMTSTRTYSMPKPQEVVRGEFERCSGTQFDPDIARIMISMIDDDKEYKMNERGMKL